MINYKMKGFTLVEIIIVLFIFTIISGAIFSVLKMGGLAWNLGDVQVAVQQDLRRGMNAMIRELRQSRSSVISGVPADDNYYSLIIFRVPEDIDNDGDVVDDLGNVEWSNSIQYSLGGYNNKQLLRVQDGTTSVLANNVNSLQLRRISVIPNILEIILLTQKVTIEGRSIQITLSSKVRLRN